MTSISANGHCRMFHVQVKAAPRPNMSASLLAISGPAMTSVDEISRKIASATVRPIASRRTFHHGAAFLDVVGGVERADQADERGRAAPQRAEDAEREQAALIGLGDAAHLFGDQLHDVWRRDSREAAHHLIRDAIDREEAREREQEQQGRKQREDEIVGQLRGESEAVVVPGLLRRPLEQLPPADRHPEPRQHTTSCCNRRAEVLCRDLMSDQLTSMA